MGAEIALPGRWGEDAHGECGGVDRDSSQGKRREETGVFVCDGTFLEGDGPGDCGIVR